MKFLLDQDVYTSKTRYLSHLGHDIVCVVQVGLSSADDEDCSKAFNKKSDCLSHETGNTGQFIPADERIIL